jgi:hypothetical protein
MFATTLLSPCMLSKNMKIKMYESTILPVLLYGHVILLRKGHYNALLFYMQYLMKFWSAEEWIILKG